MIPPDTARAYTMQSHSDRMSQGLNLEQLLKDFIASFDDLRQKNGSLEASKSELLAELEQAREERRVAEEGKSRLAAELERAMDRNRELEENGNRLVAALREGSEKIQKLQEQIVRQTSELKQSRERIAAFEQSSSANSELTKFAVATAAQMLGRAAEAVESMERAAKAEDAARFEIAKKRAVGLQMEALSLLERARDEAMQRHLETDQKAVEVLRRTRDSILFMAENVDGLPADVELGTPSATPRDREGQGTHPTMGDKRAGDVPAAPLAAAWATPPAVQPDATSKPYAGDGLAGALHQLQERLLQIRESRPFEATEETAPSIAETVEDHASAPNASEVPTLAEQEKTQLEAYRVEQPKLEPVEWKPADQESAEPELGKMVMADQELADRAALEHESVGEDALASGESPTPDEKLSDSIELEVSPFDSFASLSGFVQALKHLPNVEEARILGFEKGTLRVGLHYSSPTPPLGALLELPQFNLRLVSVRDDRIGIVVLDRES